MPISVPMAHHGATVPLMYCAVLVIMADARDTRTIRACCPLDELFAFTLTPLY